MNSNWTKLQFYKYTNKIKSIFRSEKKFICPFCNNKSNVLIPIGIDIPVLIEKQVIGGGKRLGGCLKCGSFDRERLIYIYLKDKLKIFYSSKIKNILHIAPEKHLSKKLLDFGFENYVCGDLFTNGYKYPEHVINLSILNIPFSENTFDLIICNHVLEHIENDFSAIKEIHRVLKKNAFAILQVPISINLTQTFEDFSITDPKQRERSFGQFDHVRIYGQDYTKRLEECGFKVTRINISNEYPKYGLNNLEDIFLCVK